MNRRAVHSWWPFGSNAAGSAWAIRLGAMIRIVFRIMGRDVWHMNRRDCQLSEAGRVVSVIRTEHTLSPGQFRRAEGANAES